MRLGRPNNLVTFCQNHGRRSGLLVVQRSHTFWNSIPTKLDVLHGQSSNVNGVSFHSHDLSDERVGFDRFSYSRRIKDKASIGILLLLNNGRDFLVENFLSLRV